MNKSTSMNWNDTYKWKNDSMVSTWDGNVVQDYMKTVDKYCVQASAMVTYSWLVSNWTTCSVVCGGGTQSRQVVCQSSDGKNAADSMCFDEKLTTSQSCNTQGCAGMYL